MLEHLVYLLNTDWLTLLLTASLSLTLFFWWNSEKAKNLPPGPKGVPILGNLPEMTRNAKVGQLAQFSSSIHKKYGPIISMKVGAHLFIQIADGALVAELFNREDFALRPSKTFAVMKKLSGGGLPKGIVFSYGDNHKEMRKFALLSLRDFGVGKKSIDEMVQSEAAVLCDSLCKESERTGGLVSGIKIKMQYATANVIHHIVFGYRHEYDDQRWKDLIQSLYEFFALNLASVPENFLPFLRYIPPLNNYLGGKQNKKMMELNGKLAKYIDSQIEDHRSSYCEGEIRDFIDLYIKYETENKDYYTKENIFQTILDLFRAGSDTTATSITWAILYLVKLPDIQQTLREEIDQVVGSRQYTRQDKERLIKTKAFVNEVHRCASITPTAPPHTVAKDTVVEGYTFPADSIIQASLYHIHHDENYWNEPFKFDINRWINDKGEFLRHEGHFLPFSVGKRVCPGRQIANLEFFTLLVEFLQKLKLEKAEGFENISDIPKPGLLRGPADFTFRVSRRQ